MERRVLIHAPWGQDAVLAARVLEAAGLEAGRCEAAQLAASLEQGLGALLIVEEALTPEVQAVLGRFLARQGPWSDLPILVLTQHGADTLAAQRALEKLGNVTLLERPVRTIALVSAVRSALRARERQYEARAMNRRKDEFLATLAHELRNPLAPIRNAVAILERLHPTPQVLPLVGMVERQVSHLTRLVEDLLDVARITNGKLELQLALTTTRRIVTHALEIAQASMSGMDHRVSVQQPDTDVVLRADHVRVVQSVANLLVNAAKFTPPSGDISLAVNARGDTVEFSVRDTGKGLDAADLDRIFDMFAQSRTVGQPTAGLGLGLHLTKAFAGLHGGTVSAHSEGPGRGSTFTLSLPVVVQAELVTSGSRAADGLSLPRTVLVVDDNVDAANTLEALLSLHGVRVSVAHDGAAAVERVVQERPDAVVMDIGMPVMNGYEAARHIRARSVDGAPLLVALTGWGQYADQERAAQAGFDHHFVKPLDIHELLRCLSATGDRSPGAAALSSDPAR